MKTSPCVTVIIPTHNRLAMLRQNLECLNSQTYPADKYEIIVVDNGSEDGTKNYLTKLHERGIIRYIRQAPLGPAVAGNVGAREAHGEIVAFTSDDCLPESDWLAALAESYASNESSLPIVAVGGMIKNVAEGHWLRPFYAIQGNRHKANDVEIPEYLDIANASFLRSVFLEIGGFDEAFHFPAAEDVDLGLRFTAAGYTLHTNPDAVVWHQGRLSLWGMIRQSFGRGRGSAYLRIKHPERYATPDSYGLRLKIRRSLNHLLEWSQSIPSFLRPFICGLTAMLRCGAFSLVEVFEYFIPRYLPDQISHYRSLNLPLSKQILYLSLEWCDYLMQLIGRVIGTFTYVSQQIQNEGKISQLNYQLDPQSSEEEGTDL